MEIEKTEETQNHNHNHDSELNTNSNSTRMEEGVTLNSSPDDRPLPDESFDQIELKIEKDEIISNGDFYTNPRKVNKKIHTPIGKNIDISYRYKKIGNTFTCFYNAKGDPLVLIGPHWPFFLCLSSTISFVVYMYFSLLWDKLNPYFRLAGIIIYLFQITSYTWTFLKNPGLPKYNISPNGIKSRKGVKFCHECHIFVNLDRKVHHCVDCNICIEGYDHHCPWTSKCVGDGNLIPFYCFVISTMIIFAYLIFGISIATTHK